MTEISASLNLLEVRVGAGANAKVASAKERRRVENLAQVMHGRKTTGSVGGASSTSSISPSSPRNFFLRKAISTVTSGTPNATTAAMSINTAPDESVHEFAVDGSPNRVFLAGATMWQQVPNPSGATGPTTAINGRFSYVRKNVLLFNDVMLVCDFKESDDLIGQSPRSPSKSVSGSGSGSGKKSPLAPGPSAGHLGTATLPASSAKDVLDGTEFGHIDLDDLDDLKALAKQGSLALQNVSFVKTMKLYDIPPVLADGSPRPAAAETKGAGKDTSPASNPSTGRKFYRFEILYHPTNRSNRGATPHSRSLVLCSQQKAIANQFREELRNAMISYHIHFASPVIMNQNHLNSGDAAVAAAGAAATAAASAAAAAAGGMGLGANGNSFANNSASFNAAATLQANLRLGWMYSLFGGTIFEAAFCGDVRALRNHLDHMSTYNGNFHGEGAVHALSPANIALTTPGSKVGNRGRSATSESVMSGTTPLNGIHSGIGGTNLVQSNLYYIDSLDQFGMTALHWASLNGHTVCARLLLDFGADANVRQQRGGNTALLLASAAGHAAIVSLLLRKTDSNRKANNTRVDIRNYSGHNAVEMSLFYSNIRCQKDLREARGNYSARENVVMREKQALQGVLASLYSNGMNFNEEDAAGNTPLYLCVYFNLKYGVEILMDLLGLGNGTPQPLAGLKTKGDAVNTLNDSNVAERVINSGINVNAVHPIHRCTALQLACVRLADLYSANDQELNFDTVDIIRLLIGGGAYVNWRNKNALKINKSAEKKGNKGGLDGDRERLLSASTDGSGSRDGSRRNSRDSAYSDRSGTKFSGLREEDDGATSDDDRESYSYGYDSSHTRGSVGSSQSNNTASQKAKAKSSKSKSSASNVIIGAWTPLQILQRTYVEVKLEEISILNSTNIYSSNNSGSSACGTPNRHTAKVMEVTSFGNAFANLRFSTPAPTFYRANISPSTGNNQSASSSTGRSNVTSPTGDVSGSLRSVSLFPGGRGGGERSPTSGMLDRFDEKNEQGEAQSNQDTAAGKGDPQQNNAGASQYYQQPNDSKKVSNILFQTMLIMIKAGARWREKDLIEATKGLAPPVSKSSAGGYNSDKGGYNSSGYNSAGAGGNTAMRDQKYHLLLTKPSLAFAVEECQQEWKTRQEPFNFEEFVCARQAMGDVLYQLKKHWQDDSDQNNCALCCSTFTSISNRRHHCRSCGCLVCDKCTTKRLSLAVLPPSSSAVAGNDMNVGVTKERTCDACFNQLSQQAEDTQSSNNRYCVKQLKASAELLVDRLSWFLQSLKGEPSTHTKKKESKSHRSHGRGRRSSRSPSRSSRQNSRQNSMSSPVRSGGGVGGEWGGQSAGEGRSGSEAHEDSESSIGDADRSLDVSKTPPKDLHQQEDNYRRLFTPPKHTVSSSNKHRRGSSKHTSGGREGGGSSRRESSSKDSARSFMAPQSKFFACPGGSGYRESDGTAGPSSPVRLSLIENDVGLYKMLQHRHLVQQQLEALLECDYLTQAFLDASRMYQAEAEAVLF